VKIDLHIHTATGSDGAYSLEDVFEEASKRKIDFMSITDHDSIVCQEKAIELAAEKGIGYVTGVELNVSFEYQGKSVSLDFLGYNYDYRNRELTDKLAVLADHREKRARQILDNLNVEFDKENIARLTDEDLKAIQDSVDGTFGRPHIANYLVDKGIVSGRQEAFDKYLVKCDVPKYPLSLAEASGLIRNAGGVLVLAHPNDPNGTSLVKITSVLKEQIAIVSENMLEYIDGVECWHSRHDSGTTAHYIGFAGVRGLIMTGGSDCHQKPVMMGTVEIPDFVAGQFEKRTGSD
jgi:hypothetical protein